ncbi:MULTISPECIES: hypothetical protein [Streptomyces]|jgi:hypothetical protein|uniref:Uncharacterized protein n=1 Tax=Streptomyces niveus TaxID=193462 RepID=A0ABZ2AA81_STRNV|nr:MULTISPECIES: hypothetical protein [Streptomyces]TFI30888.1 hypothetical protein E4P36_03855 [Streptomyces sp. 4R-3d]WTA60494.1 hypothetical protein OG211_19490 [Streptomyces niveus]
MFEPETRTPSRVADDVAELEAVVHSGGFWRLVPEVVPRVYAPVTPELLRRVEQGLRRVAR